MRLFILFILLPLSAWCQKSDFISLKKKQKTINHYFKNTQITFLHTNGGYVSGIIMDIKHDSIFLKIPDIRQMGNPWGIPIWDTVAVSYAKYHYKEIAAIPKPPRSFEFVRNGLLLKIAGAGYGTLHTVNGLIQKDKIDPIIVAASAGAYGLGIALKKSRRYEYSIGNKYTIQYVGIAD